MKFFSFWRSLASFRVRIALNLKNVPAEVIFVDLDANAHRDPEYRKINPQMALPALVADDGTTLFQSLAILEYLDEKYPAPPLLPSDPAGRARVRALALMVACEGHPLLTPRVRRYLDHELNLRDTQQAAWRRHWRGILPATRRRAASAMAINRRWPTSAWWATSPSRSCSRLILRPGRR